MMKRGADSTTGPCPSASLQPLLETLEDPGAAPGVLTDALLTFTNRLNSEEGKEFSAQVEKHFPQLYKIFKTHIPTENSQLSSAALQALGFSVFNAKIASLLCEAEIHELLSIVNSVALKAVDKNTLTRALWVISKQAFPSSAVGKLVPSIITMLETIFNKDDLHSVVVEYEALNVIIRLIEQAPSHMEEHAVRWAKLIIPLVVHSAHKVQLRGATALEMGMPLLLQKQSEVAAVTEELMTTKIIPDLQKLFSSKNETYVLKLWPLFVKLLGKALHRSGSFINSLLQLEELGFRSATPVVKKIAFIAWKSLIDNFALNPEILCSAKRLRLLMQPLSSIHVRTEGLALTKLEVWWYLLMRLGPQLPAHFEQVCVPLIQSTLSLDASVLQGNSSRLSSNQSLVTSGSAHKSGSSHFGTSSQRMSLNSSAGTVAVPSIQLLGIEMLLHFFMGSEVLTFAKENSIVLSLEPLQCSVITSPSFFCKHASTFINAVQDGFVAIGKDTSDIVLSAVWKEMIGFVRAAVESGSKRERQSLEVLTLLLQALKNIVESNELPALKSLSLIEITIKELPPKILGSPAYQVANMDLLNGTPALFLIQLIFREDILKCGIQDERVFLNYESLVGFVLSGPASPLAFSESVFVVINQSAEHLENKEHLWRIWSIIVNPLTDWINQTNEVNQGDALEHNFSAIYSALLLPVNHIFSSSEFPQTTMKTLLRSWSELYRTFARCALLVATAEDNLSCEELCARIVSRLGDEAHINQSMLEGLSHILSVMVDCINFAPFGTKCSARRSPQAPPDWSKKKRDPLGMLSSLIKLKVISINSLRRLVNEDSGTEKLISDSVSIVNGLQSIIAHISLSSVVRSLFGTITKPLAEFYEKIKSVNSSRLSNGLNSKLDKLLTESINCLQSNYTGSFDSELLQEIYPLLCIMLLNKNKQMRNQAAQFWNATFGKAALLTYPEELKPVLSQARQKILLSLPSFESTEIVGESNETCSDSLECSQWDSKLSGIEVKPCGKRGSLLRQTNELKQNSIGSPTATSKMKLDLTSAKANRKNVFLEEENTVDFVVIPPEAKERVLTEHQKEVLRTKRVDIPTMYNNLDASQDTTLFSQYSQSQEDSLDKPNSNVKEEKEMENKVVSQNETDLLSISHEVPGNDKANILPEKTNCSSAEHLPTLAKTTLDPKHKLEVGAFETIPEKTSVLEVSLTEINSNVSSSSSSSSDVISGTPQPVSRRQSFITLEKFDSSGNKPFSPSTFNMSGTSADVSSLTKQENMNVSAAAASSGKPEMEAKNVSKLKNEEIITRSKRSCLEIIDALETYDQPKKFKEIANSELQSENTPPIKRSSLKQNKVELLEENKSIITQADWEKNMHVSPTKDTENKHKESNETQEAECLIDIPSQSCNLSVNGNTSVDSKQILDTVAENKPGPNLDSKENTPPELISSGDTVSDVGQTSPALPTQKTLRRSLRRKPETTEVPSDSQDKENSQQKKDGRKDTEKVLPKKAPPIKEAAGQKLKPAAEKNMDAQGGITGSGTREGTTSKESHASGSIKEETNINIEKSESSNASDTDDLQDSGLATTDEKSKGLPRYHTRRTSQGLLTSIENSESDSSEAREEGTKKKRSGRWKNKNLLGSQTKDSQEINSQIQTTSKEQVSISSEEPKEIAEYSDGNEKVDKNTLPLGECLELKLPKDSPRCGRSTATVKNSDKIPTQSFCEPPLENRQEIGTSGTDSSPSSNTVSADAYATAVSGFSSSEEPLETPDCQHKRSKRTRRSKSCDCCGERPSLQLERSPTELKKQGTPQSKLKEHKKISNKGAVTLQSTLAADSSSPEKFKAEPCAASTPLPCTQDLPDLKDSSSLSKSEMDLVGADTPEGKLKKLASVKNESDMPVAETSGCVDFVEAPPVSTDAESKPSSAYAESKEVIAHCLETSAESAPAQQSNTDHSGELKNEINMEVDDNQPEETKVSEAITTVQSTEENEVITSVTEALKPEGNKMAQDDDAENDTAYASTDPGISNLLPKESNSSDSPLKLKELDAVSLAKISESPNGVQARCVWSPSASPTTSILKRGMKRQQEEDSPSPANKSRRVSFANPIYHEEVADDIDRRSSVVRTHSSNGSPSFRSIKPSPNPQAKHIATPTKGSLSPGTRSHKYKSSKKCLITEMVKEPLPAPTESIYPALMECKASVDTILPQITSNIWARGLGQLIRAKNIRTVGDLSSLTAAEIKTLPIRSPKVSNVKRALKAYHEQQVKSRGSDEVAGLDDTEKPVNGIDEKSLSTNEDNIETNLSEPVTSGADEQSAVDILAQINMLGSHITSENLLKCSGSELFEMQEKLHNMAHCIMKNLQTRWKSPSRESIV